MRALIAGLGSIGKRHLGNVRALFPQCQVAVWRHSRPETDAPVEPGVDRYVYDVAAALAFAPDLAILASPAPHHISAALELANSGVHLLIEKPISDTEANVENLVRTCQDRGLVLMVGYNLRFHESLRAMRQLYLDGRVGRLVAIRAEVGSYLPDWRPGSDYRKVVSARPELGGGAVLELSHEIDYVRWLAGEVTSVSAQLGRTQELGIDVEDTAEITLRLSSGALAQVHVDMVQRAPNRTCRIVGTEGTLIWDAIANSVRLYDAKTREWQSPWPPQELDRNAMYRDELTHFVDCIEHRKAPIVTGLDGWRVLQIALAAKQSDSEQRTIFL